MNEPPAVQYAFVPCGMCNGRGTVPADTMNAAGTHEYDETCRYCTNGMVIVERAA